MGERGTCRHCNAQVLWVETQNGAKMPLDFEPERRYVTETYVPKGEDAFARGAAGHMGTVMRARQRNVYTCHFDTCRKRGA